jgi:pyruvate dehydrogenase E1 component
MMGSQSLDNLKQFRGYGGVQSYPSRTKDKGVEVDFSTGSVGLGAAVTTFAAYIQVRLARRQALGSGSARLALHLRLQARGSL